MICDATGYLRDYPKCKTKNRHGLFLLVCLLRFKLGVVICVAGGALLAVAQITQNGNVFWEFNFQKQTTWAAIGCWVIVIVLVLAERVIVV